MCIKQSSATLARVGLCVVPLLILTPTIAAENGNYPERTIKMVIGFPAGQSSDVVARYYAQKLSEELGQTVYVENRPGATGIIAHEYVKNAAPDGYTILMTSGAPLAISPALYKNISYDSAKDFSPIILTNTTPMFLATAVETPVNNYAEMAAYLKERPGKVNYGSGGNGVTTHIVMEMLKEAGGLDLTHIPYKGAPAMMTDLIAGRVTFGFETSTAVLPQASGGRLKLLGVTSAERSSAAPDVPTLAEQGVEGFDVVTWAGIVAPAGVPEPIVTRLNTALQKVLARDDVVAYLKSIGGEPAGGTPQDFGTFINSELATWGAAVKASGARLD